MTEGQKLILQLAEKMGSQKVAAEVIGISWRNVQNWCIGKLNPTPQNIARIRMALDSDNMPEREQRIRRYIKRASTQQNLFRSQ